MNSGVGDIIERDTSGADPTPPKAPGPKKPLQKKWGRRRPVVLDPTAPGSRTRPATSSAVGAPPGIPENAPSGAPGSGDQPPLSDSERIHLENIRKMQKMTPEEIEREREEIFRAMDPAVLESLLRRAELKEAESKEADTPSQHSQAGELKPPGRAVSGTRAPPKGSVADWDPSPVELSNNKGPPLSESQQQELSKERLSRVEADQPSQLDTISDDSEHFHFPSVPEELRHYFPGLPVETEKLAWMQPISGEEEAEYSEELVSVAPSELRFDFQGNLITPRLSRLISQTAGLHHHGDAPSAAGYTLPELAHLSRSSHPAQRSIAIQTAGRVLHKLRARKFARSSDLQEGLEALVHTTRILDTLTEAASEKTRSLTVRTLATEALWLANTTSEAKQTKQDD